MADDIARRLAALTRHQRALLEARALRVPAVAALVNDLPPAVPNGAQHVNVATSCSEQQQQSRMSFSVFFFSDNGATAANDKYRLLFECARYADRNGFEAVWTPERHFQAFGGLYPNPSVLAAALAMTTDRIAIRAGSVVLPLHPAARVAEEWSLVDNLSGGRVGIAVASGWHPDDFVLMPQAFPQRRTAALDLIATVQRLWRGESLEDVNGKGERVTVRVYPRPIQAQLPTWLTAMSEQSFIEAGRRGLNVLTGLMDQDLEQCARRIARYRDSLADSGFDPCAGRVTLMLHTYIEDDMVKVREAVRQPMLEYLRAFMHVSEAQLQADRSVQTVLASDDDRQAILEHAFERYLAKRSLLGTPQSCRAMVHDAVAVGVDEIACLLDFGLDAQRVLASLQRVDALRAEFSGRAPIGVAS